MIFGRAAILIESSNFLIVLVDLVSSARLLAWTHSPKNWIHPLTNLLSQFNFNDLLSLYNSKALHGSHCLLDPTTNVSESDPFIWSALYTFVRLSPSFFLGLVDMSCLSRAHDWSSIYTTPVAFLFWGTYY